jgi:hypothetical protein
MVDNPLQRFFRRPALWIKLPTGGRWYTGSEVNLDEKDEVQIYGLTAVDEVMLNTPDALLNGEALEHVIKSCVPDVKNVKRLMQPDLDTIYLGIKAASNGGKFEMERKCPKCEHENNFEVNCNALLNHISYIEDSDCVVNINGEINVHIKPYDFQMRSILLQKQFEEQRALTAVENESTDLDEFKRADILAKSVAKLTTITFHLVAKTISAIDLLGPEPQTVTDPTHIAEWLLNVETSTANAVIEAVNILNTVGPPRSTTAKCEACGNEWSEQLSFDPVVFFQRS